MALIDYTLFKKGLFSRSPDIKTLASVRFHDLALNLGSTNSNKIGKYFTQWDLLLIGFSSVLYVLRTVAMFDVFIVVQNKNIFLGVRKFCLPFLCSQDAIHTLV